MSRPEEEIEIVVDLSEIEPLELDTDEAAWVKWQGVPCWGELDGTKSNI